jgi:hypothetical protein
MSALQVVSGSRAEFDLGPYRVEVFRSDGGVHLRIVAGPFPSGRLVTVANFMPDGDTPAQLRALAAHLDGVGP